MTKMAAMPIYGKKPSNIFFSETNRLISVKLFFFFTLFFFIFPFLVTLNFNMINKAQIIDINLQYGTSTNCFVHQHSQQLGCYNFISEIDKIEYMFEIN